MSWVAYGAPLPKLSALHLLEVTSEGEQFFWDRGEEQIAATGALARIRASGAARFARGSREAQALLQAGVALGPAAARERPPLVGGFAFADEESTDPDWREFPPLDFTLPRVALLRRGDRTTLWVAEALAEGRTPDVRRPGLEERWQALARAVAAAAEAHRKSPAAFPFPTAETRIAAVATPVARAERCSFYALVRGALSAIASGRAEKLVVARAVELKSRAGAALPALLRALRRGQPGCTVFAVCRGAVSFVGASPECLLRLRGGRAETWALAGSTRRGRDAADDTALAEALRGSVKERAEHAVVVRALGEQLAPWCTALHSDPAPRVKRFADLQHLATRIRGVLRAPADALEVAGQLHPSPAVAGWPRATALRWLDECEALERGWYAGGVGFTEATGEGEFCVALRAALLSKEWARLYAGAGIVAGSRPGREFGETQLKLAAMAAPIGGL